ncbi:hypothetical protein ACFPN1_02990 [Lysobacter yangpyeongensis]|uniref:GNAT family N-acetyltransferase n=1 Tax=Lysobacter yangpyeongensis TaxID=346182 RepID=A0ABW0SJH8_9GAMM
MNTETSFEITPVWKSVTPELSEELIGLWSRNKAIDDPVRARARASQAVCITRDGSGAICGVGTAIVRVLPRLRQPLYFYRQFFAPEFRGQKQTVPFFNRARRILQDYNAALATPESLGVLLELENPMLARHYTRAYEPAGDSAFIGYSPKGLQLRVSYFEGARLLPPVQLQRRTSAVAGRAGHA